MPVTLDCKSNAPLVELITKLIKYYFIKTLKTKINIYAVTIMQ